MTTTREPSHPSRGASGWLPAWTLLAALALGFGLGGPALIEPDEGRNAAIAAEMVDGGELWLPRLEGLPYLDKPFLFFTLIAGSIRLLGRDELAVRLPALLSAWATVALVGWFGARRLGSRAGLVAALAIATTPLFVAFARTAIFDATLCLCVTAALVCFHHAVEEGAAEESPGNDDGDDSRRGGMRPPAAARRWALAAWSAIGVGVLVKGPVALVLPLLVVLPWAAWLRRLRRLASPLALLAFAVLVVPWTWAVERELPGFLRYVVVTETWQRMTSDALERSEPVWFFVPFVLAGFLPWSLAALAAAPAGWRQRRRGAETRLVVFLALWVALPLLLFSLSRSKQPQYVLPLAPAVALLAAWGLRGAGARRGAIAGAAGWAVLAVPLVLTGLQVIPVETRVDAETSAGIYSAGLGLGAAALMSAAATAVLVRRRRRLEWTLLTLTLPVVLFPWITARSLGEIAEIRSSRGIAAALAERMGPESRLIGIETYSPTLSFYLGRRTLVSSRDGAPFRANYVMHAYPRLVDGQAGSLRPEGWWRRALAECASPDFFVVDRQWTASRDELEAAGLEPFHEAFRLLAYGPCRPAAAASDGEETGR
ncbi:MAG TPA: glycosyltransferase family 39 protein [Thermoanaerobaculia bacterium]|nr:glycosyltransferase family 39 protein [Thermoanaerobaculia bacterium]